MPYCCSYRNCQNLASFTYGGYCTQAHQERAEEDEFIERYRELLKKIYPRLTRMFGDKNTNSTN